MFIYISLQPAVLLICSLIGRTRNINLLHKSTKITSQQENGTKCGRSFHLAEVRLPAHWLQIDQICLSLSDTYKLPAWAYQIRRQSSITSRMIKLLLFVGLLVNVFGRFDAAVVIETIPRLLGVTSNVPVPAFASIYASEDETKPMVDRFTLYVSTFKPLALGQVIRSAGPFSISVIMLLIIRNQLDRLCFLPTRSRTPTEWRWQLVVHSLGQDFVLAQ